MSEESKKNEDSKIELPLDMFVKQGTSTSANDARLEQEFLDAERRRNEDDAMRRLAQIPVEQGGARMFERRLNKTDEGPTAYLHVTYCNRYGQEYETGVADIFVGTPKDPLELVIELICPSCARRKPHLQDCIIQIRQSNRNFHFVPAGQDSATQFFRFGGDGEVYRTAGVVRESEAFRCPHCSYKARFENNKLRED